MDRKPPACPPTASSCARRNSDSGGFLSRRPRRSGAGGSEEQRDARPRTTACPRVHGSDGNPDWTPETEWRRRSVSGAETWSDSGCRPTAGRENGRMDQRRGLQSCSVCQDLYMLLLLVIRGCCLCCHLVSVFNIAGENDSKCQTVASIISLNTALDRKPLMTSEIHKQYNTAEG